MEKRLREKIPLNEQQIRNTNERTKSNVDELEKKWTNRLCSGEFEGTLVGRRVTCFKRFSIFDSTQKADVIADFDFLFNKFKISEAPKTITRKGSKKSTRNQKIEKSEDEEIELCLQNFSRYLHLLIAKLLERKCWINGISNSESNLDSNGEQMNESFNDITTKHLKQKKKKKKKKRKNGPRYQKALTSSTKNRNSNC